MNVGHQDFAMATAFARRSFPLPYALRDPAWCADGHAHAHTAHMAEVQVEIRWQQCNVLRLSVRIRTVDKYTPNSFPQTAAIR